MKTWKLVVVGAGGAVAQPDSLWSRTYGGRRDDVCSSLIQTADGGFAIAGITASFGNGGEDFWLVRTNAVGDSIWSRTYGGVHNDACTSLIQTTDGGFAMAGRTMSFGAGAFDFWLMRTDMNGDSLWSRSFGGRFDDGCNSLIQTTDGGFAMAGSTILLDQRVIWLMRIYLILN